MDKPRWLDEEPEILKLVHYFLDKLDNKPAQEWKQPPAVTLEAKRFPRLFKLGDTADREWALLKSLSTDYHVLDIKLNRRRDPYDPEYANARLYLNQAAEQKLRVWLNRPERIPYALQWREAIDLFIHAFPGDTTGLINRPIRVQGKTVMEVVAALANLGQYSHSLMSLRQLSARCFWGHSKVLDTREDLIKELFPDLQIHSRPVIVNVYLPARIDGVLFIENQDSYTRAIGGIPQTVDKLVLVYCSGFMGSAQRIRDHDGVRLHYEASTVLKWKEAFESGWFESENFPWPVYFWGDLDYSGLAILKALRHRFENTQAWQPGYEKMLACLKQGLGHKPELANKEEQIDPKETGCSYADQVLLPALREQKIFVDQEIIY